MTKDAQLAIARLQLRILLGKTPSEKDFKTPLCELLKRAKGAK